ncbi:hypothetical protein [Bacillus sp. AFS055030]|uniref:hypothetical protein n=1 Tax=Bacillus sp. AFS055030 TaxID=2033507 RepID=UPI000BFCDB9C|nr:hypothetical protein [Bacillus sp. AFS055030]PGL73227.1 hypothetical protein CN925_00815 [Bacillus sp. AFS055030]
MKETIIFLVLFSLTFLVVYQLNLITGFPNKYVFLSINLGWIGLVNIDFILIVFLIFYFAVSILRLRK